MSWDISVVKEEGIIYAVASGEITMGLALQMTAEGLKLAIKHRITLFLVDLRTSTSDISTVQIYRLPTILETLGLSRDRRIALVIPSDPADPADYRFYQTVSKNRGFMIGLFEEPDSARQWLLTET